MRYVSIVHLKFFILTDFLFLTIYVAAAYFVSVATFAAFTGQHAVRKLITILGRASLIIFILAFTIFVSAVSLGKHRLVQALTILFCSDSE